MASHPLNYEPFPEVNPSGGPDARQNIHADPDMFGAAIGKAEQGLGTSIEGAANEGLDVATQQARMDAQTHANEVHSWQSDQVTQAQEKFLTLRGKDAEMALPDFKKQIDAIHEQARSQAGNPYTAQLIDSEGRRLTDSSYAQSARHAAEQKSVWDTNVATDGAASAGSRAALGAAITPGDTNLNANPSVVLGLDRSDIFASQAAKLKGLDGDIEAQKNRGRNVEQIIKSTVADGSQTSLQRAITFFHSQYDKMDPGSRATIEQSLKSQAATYDGQKTADIYMGRGPYLPPGYADRTNQIESGGDPHAETPSGTYKGLGQFSPKLEVRYGLNASNRGDPVAVAKAYSSENAENHDALARALGHEPTPADYYLAHQQGIGGAVAHISQPNLPAWQNMFSTVEGREKGQGWAKQAIWGNMTPDMKAQFPGGVETVTSGDFARMWAQRFYQQPIQAIGTIPGNGTQVSGAQQIGMAVPRFQMAQDFSEANKADVLKRITNDPYLLDHPQAMNAALSYTNKIFESNTAAYADQERNLRIMEQQKKMISEDTENTYLKQIYAPAGNAKPLAVQDIVLDDRLTRESKDRLIKLIGDPGERDDKTYGPGFVSAFRAVHAPEGSEGRITDVNQLYPRLGPNGDLTMAGVEKLRGEIDLRKSPEGSAEAEMKKTFLEFAKKHISGEDQGLNIKDPKGEQNYLRFMAYALPAYDAGRKAGKSPAQLLDPKSADYIGKPIDDPGLGFVRPTSEWYADVIVDHPNQPGAKPTNGSKPATAAPAFDINKVQSLEELNKAYASNAVTGAQARQYAVAKGWMQAKPAAPASPVSQFTSGAAGDGYVPGGAGHYKGLEPFGTLSGDGYVPGGAGHYKDFRRSENVEDRRPEDTLWHRIKSYFGDGDHMSDSEFRSWLENQPSPITSALGRALGGESLMTHNEEVDELLKKYKDEEASYEARKKQNEDAIQASYRRLGLDKDGNPVKKKK